MEVRGKLKAYCGECDREGYLIPWTAMGSYEEYAVFCKTCRKVMTIIKVEEAEVPSNWTGAKIEVLSGGSDAEACKKALKNRRKYK